jgi:hypothetical protein
MDSREKVPTGSESGVNVSGSAKLGICVFESEPNGNVNVLEKTFIYLPVLCTDFLC